MQLRVLVVDDEPLAREGLKLLLGRQPQVSFRKRETGEKRSP